MGATKFLEPYQLVADASMGADVTSAPSFAKRLDNIGIHIEWTGAPQGTFSVEATVQEPSANKWFALTFSPVLTAPGGAPGDMGINLNQLPYTAFRVKFTRTSGTGTMNVWIDAKGL
jgi:hypothetical protein